MKISLLAWAGPIGGGALVLAARGFALPEDGSMVQVPAPQGAGLHIYDGELEGEVFRGVWHRANRRDLEEWNVPISEPTETPGWCCAMRQKFLVGIIGNDISVEAPVDLADFVINWEPITIQIKYCPFCGSRMGTNSSMRTVA